MIGTWTKKGFIFKAAGESPWWASHTMAPSAILLNPSCIRVYCGCWNEAGISSIGFVDVDARDPSKILGVSDSPILTPGRAGTFDDNGVFPAHAYVHEGTVYLYYTGFQLVDKVRYTNFGGLAKGPDGLHFHRVSEAPVLDRADEGLHVRAGQSILVTEGTFKTCYSAGSGWEQVQGQLRPRYDVFYQESSDGITYQKSGTCIVKCDSAIEHGLGRPQIVQLRDRYYVFYTRRILDRMRYTLGCATSADLRSWERIDEWVALPFGTEGDFDSEMVYFPSVVKTKEHVFLFYCGNHFGRDGLGYAQLGTYDNS
jgi:predicted GH43/DUF377 family glycosyl hydrolase